MTNPIVTAGEFALLVGSFIMSFILIMISLIIEKPERSLGEYVSMFFSIAMNIFIALLLTGWLLSFLAYTDEYIQLWFAS